MATPINEIRQLNNEVVEALRIAAKELKMEKLGKHFKLRHLEQIVEAQKASTAAFEIRDMDILKEISAVDVGKVKAERERDQAIKAIVDLHEGLKWHVLHSVEACSFISSQ